MTAGSANAHDSLGEALALVGDPAGAAASYTRALELTADPEEQQRIRRILAGLEETQG